MLRLISLVLILLLAAGCRPAPERSSSAEAPPATLQTPGTPVQTPAASPGSALDRQEEQEREKILAAAKAYMERQGLKVGEGPGEIVLSVEQIWDGRAVVLYGFAASEFFAELGMRREAGEWKVSHDQARYFAFGEEVDEPLAALAAAEGYVFGEEPGKYLAGMKDFSQDRAVLLVAPYGEPWAWEYVLEKKQESWVITAKNKANEHWEPAR